MTPVRWTDLQIKAAHKAGRVPVVLRTGDSYKSMTVYNACRIAEGTYMVQAGKHEIVVHLDSLKK